MDLRFSGSGQQLVSLTAPTRTLGLGTSAAVERFLRVPVGSLATGRCGRHTRKQAGKALHSHGHLHSTKLSSILATRQQTNCMYKNTSGYVHRWVKPWTRSRAPPANRHSVVNHIASLGPSSPQWHVNTGVQAHSTNLHFARFVAVLMGLPFPIADPVPAMFLPVVGKYQREISNSPRLLSLTGWCFPPLGLVITIRFGVVGHGDEEVCVVIILPSHVLPAERHVSIVRPWMLTLVSANGWIFLDFMRIWSVPALAIIMAVTILKVSFVVGIQLQLHSHVLDY